MRNQIRIIGGQYKGRKISFPNIAELRPTPDRVRETLFNWLSPFIMNAQCLDLFAGSAALSIEAISRGAANVICLEKNPLAAAAIEKNAQTLHINALTVVQIDACTWLENPKNVVSTFDIVFLDPPYQQACLPLCFLLLEKHWLHAHSVIYFESPHPIKNEDLPCAWKIHKEKKAGQIYYYLAEKC